MRPLLTADEIFAMAVQIEANGAAFYRAAAEQQDDASTKEFLCGLVEVEEQHKRIFAEMRAEVKSDAGGAGRVSNEGGLYMAAIGAGYRLEGSPAVTQALTGDESLEEILRLAIDLEKEAILFYVGLKDVTSDAGDQAKVEAIIREERGHVATLANKLREAK